jgi:hypothetical protein
LEYCRTDVTASLGVLGIDSEGQEHHSMQVPKSPVGLAKRYEAGLAKIGLDWSPLKFYYRRFTRFDATDRQWRLLLQRTDRAEWNSSDPQLVNLMITIRTLAGEPFQEIHEELVRSMTSYGWNFRNIESRARTRISAKS